MKYFFTILFIFFPLLTANSQVVSGVELEISHSPSLFSLFWQASAVVQIVMLGLIVASIWCWGIIVDKVLLVGRTRRRIKKFEKLFWSGQSLDSLYQHISQQNYQSCPMSSLFVSAMGEWRRSLERNLSSAHGLQGRIDKALEVSLNRQMERLENRLLYLASLGSAAPFVGLFGTVIGIMGSFQAIAGSKSTNLAVVAPGIAEALLATALGLLAAIPAVIAYNKFSSDMSGIGAKLEGFADEFSAILSRQLDERSSSS